MAVNYVSNAFNGLRSIVARGLQPDLQYAGACEWDLGAQATPGSVCEEVGSTCR